VLAVRKESAPGKNGRNRGEDKSLEISTTEVCGRRECAGANSHCRDVLKEVSQSIWLKIGRGRKMVVNPEWQDTRDAFS
jgi:hypothetical protein